MAQCLRRPVLSAIGLQRSQRRYFRAVSPQFAINQNNQPQLPRQRPSQSMRLQAKESGIMQSDIGLLPDTIIPLKVSLYHFPRCAVIYCYALAVTRFYNFLGLMVYKFTYKPRPKLQLRRIKPAAVGLHRQMCTAMAEGDVAALKEICTDGLRDNLVARVHQRGKETWTWELIKYTKRTKVVSHKFAPLGIAGFAVRQAVVRISSRQRLTRYGPDGMVVPGTGGEKAVKEYIVIQKNIIRGKEGDWRIWGTTKETTYKEIMEMRERHRNM